ncbi:hypothetical protein INT47_000863 [Mucor saturninus]|uniref:Uncharacterized protein n=1 Tax=Mucor saturninus TaxID=64648 RepID=A0A8H7RNJ7_9FUNG|nr:hypothetical protein INT47_000863 [Mucor saturninus]
MGFFIRYLRKHYPKTFTTEFDVLDAFIASDYTNQAMAESEFISDIKQIASWSPCPLQKWALNQSQSFACLQKTAIKNHWTSIVFAQTNAEESKAYYLHRAKSAQENANAYLNKENAVTLNIENVPVIDKGKKAAEVSEVEEDEDEDEDKQDIPSDLTIEHHPYRTCQYSITYAGYEESSNNARTDASSKWDINNLCISDLCYSLKQTTARVVENVDPAQISDIRILVLNDIYLFDKDSSFSVSKYFHSHVHNAIKPTLFFGSNTINKGLDCYNWCTQLETCPPVDWLPSLTLCAEFLTSACKSGNVLDVHTAQVLTQILPMLINGPMDDTVEDSYVHHYLSPLLCSVFSSDSRLRLNWANGQLKSETTNSFKPDFTVYNLSGSAKCVILIAEFKHKDQNSYVESDLVKLGKQMKLTLNLLIKDGVKKPKVCGIHCEGEEVYTFIMDMPSPKLYRMCNVSKIKLFKNLDQISLLPSILSHLLYLKTIACETASKIEDAILFKYDNLKRPSPNPPTDWISSSSVTVNRVPKRQKK